MDISESEIRLTLVWQLLISLGILAASEVVARGRTDLQQTTLRTAWGWAVAALAAWIITWVADQCLKVASPPLADHAWYACAVMALCPPMAVLGSRRPGTRVWMWFILFPMLLALAWPLIAVRLQSSELRGIQLELPQFCAFTLILVMGVGNYLGTRFTIPALLYAAAVLPSVVSLSSIAPSWLEDRSPRPSVVLRFNGNSDCLDKALATACSVDPDQSVVVRFLRHIRDCLGTTNSRSR